MERTALLELVEQLADVDVAGLDRDAATAVLGQIGRLRGWTEHLRLGVVARVAELSPTPERDITGADGSSSRDAARDITSAQALGSNDLSGPAASLAEGAISRAHLDLLGETFRGLGSAELRDRFRALLPGLDELARITPYDQFARHVRRVVEQLRREAGEDRLAQQRRSTRLSLRVDIATGMVDLFGRFDPRSGLALRNRLEEIRDQLAATGLGDHPDAPTDPLLRPGWLLAQALLHLVNGTAGASRRPEVSVVVDARGAHRAGRRGESGAEVLAEVLADVLAEGTEGTAARSAEGAGEKPVMRGAAGVDIDWGADVELPLDQVQAVAEQAAVHVIVTDGDRIVSAPGRLDLGRTSRLATADQRRALRAVYPRCAIPDCPTAFDRCDIHHVVPWEEGGATDLDNLLPICAHHHQRLHLQRWRLELDTNRQLTITLPDMSVLHAVPPRRGAA